jgi:RimK family alpha-L-glutamate ligase
MNLLILTRYPQEYEPTRLKTEAENLGLKPLILSYKKITVKEGKTVLDNGRYSLSQFKYIIPRAASGPSGSLVKQKTALLKALSTDQACLNKKSFLKYPLTGKILQSEVFKNIVPIVPNFVFYQKSDWEDFLEKAKFPLIVKGAFGSHGRQVFAAGDKNQAKEIISQQNWQELIFQPLINSPFWVRALVLKGKFLGAIPRKTKSRFLPGKEISLPEKLNQKDLKEIKKISLNAAQVLEADFAGIDFLCHHGKWLLLELNRTPQFKIFERKTNINVARKIIEAVGKYNP